MTQTFSGKNQKMYYCAVHENNYCWICFVQKSVTIACFYDYFGRHFRLCSNGDLLFGMGRRLDNW